MIVIVVVVIVIVVVVVVVFRLLFRNIACGSVDSETQNEIKVTRGEKHTPV